MVIYCPEISHETSTLKLPLSSNLIENLIGRLGLFVPLAILNISSSFTRLALFPSYLMILQGHSCSEWLSKYIVTVFVTGNLLPALIKTSASRLTSSSEFNIPILYLETGELFYLIHYHLCMSLEDTFYRSVLYSTDILNFIIKFMEINIVKSFDIGHSKTW